MSMRAMPSVYKTEDGTEIADAEMKHITERLAHDNEQEKKQLSNDYDLPS